MVWSVVLLAAMGLGWGIAARRERPGFHRDAMWGLAAGHVVAVLVALAVHA